MLTSKHCKDRKHSWPPTKKWNNNLRDNNKFSYNNSNNFCKSSWNSPGCRVLCKTNWQVFLFSFSLSLSFSLSHFLFPSQTMPMHQNVSKLEQQQDKLKAEASNKTEMVNRTTAPTCTTMAAPTASTMATIAAQRKETVAVNTEISQQDLLTNPGPALTRAMVMREKGTGSGVVKQDKQVSTSTPPSVSTTPTGQQHQHQHHYLQHHQQQLHACMDRLDRAYNASSNVGHGTCMRPGRGGNVHYQVESQQASSHDAIRGGVTRVSNAVAVSAHPVAGVSQQQQHQKQLQQQSLARRLPQPMSEDVAAMAAPPAPRKQRSSSPLITMKMRYTFLSLFSHFCSKTVFGLAKRRQP